MKILEIRKIENNPFQVAKVNDNDTEKYFIIIGNTKIAKEFTSFEDAEKYINDKPYELIFAISEAVYNFKNQKNGNNKNNH